MRYLSAAAVLLAAGTLTYGAQVPRPSPDYTFNLPGGKQVQLSDHKGKVIALEFLKPSCPHCQNTAKILTKLQSEYGPRGFQALGVATEGDPIAFAKQFGVTYPVGTSTPDGIFSYLQHSVMDRNFYVPQLVIIDRGGTIRAQHSGVDPFFKDEEKNIRALVEKLLSEPPPKENESGANQKNPKKRSS
ncbi:MAG: TlpA family protein disulfide reductase [Bryobacteraceae bacterium]